MVWENNTRRRTFTKIANITLLCVLFLAASGFDTTVCSNENNLQNIKDIPNQKSEAQNNNTTSSPVSGLYFESVSFYQDYLSQLWPIRCPSYPSCSHYSLVAVEKHGLLLGIVMTFDRLLHETDERKTSPLIELNGELKIYDPVENNDFWWYKAGSAKQSD